MGSGAITISTVRGGDSKGLAGSLAVNVIANRTKAYIKDSIIDGGIEVLTAADVNVTAGHDRDADVISGGVAGSLGVGIGVSAGKVDLSGAVKAYIDDGASIGFTEDDGSGGTITNTVGSVTVSAISTVDDATTFGLAGAVGVAAGAGVDMDIFVNPTVTARTGDNVEIYADGYSRSAYLAGIGASGSILLGIQGTILETKDETSAIAYAGNGAKINERLVLTGNSEIGSDVDSDESEEKKAIDLLMALEDWDL